MQNIVLFDGVCNFCNAWVDFILPRDKNDRFRFVVLQSAAGKKILSTYHLHFDTLDTLVLIEDDSIYTHSTAALRILHSLGSIWSILYGFIIIPKFIRDGVYDIISRNRYGWFGERAVCRIPTEGEHHKFIE